MKKIKEMMQETDTPVMLTNQLGIITYVNEPFRVVFGWNADEIVGQSLTAVIPRSFHDAHHLGFSRFVITEKSRVLNHPLQLKAVTKDGREIDAEHFIIAEQHQEQWIFGATLRPLS